MGNLAVEFTLPHEKGQLMDLGILAALGLIAVWAVVALGFNGPGWIHLLLTVGIAMLIWRIAARNQPQKRK
ncbi:MAG TPA: hypothetical protein VF737_12855 [Gemmatimonadaceae bacterium]